METGKLPEPRLVVWTTADGKTKNFGPADEAVIEVPREFGTTRLTVRKDGVVEVDQQSPEGEVLHSEFILLAQGVKKGVEYAPTLPTEPSEHE